MAMQDRCSDNFDSVLLLTMVRLTMRMVMMVLTGMTTT